MKEKYDEEENDNIINSNEISNKNNLNSLKNINTYTSTINEKSTIFDDNILLNNNSPFQNSNITNYIQSSIQTFPSPINKLEKIEEKKEINEMSSIDIPNKSIIDNLSDKIETQYNINIQGMSIIPVNSIKDNSISQDCNLGLSIVQSSLLSSFMKVDANSVLFPLLNIRKSCFRKLSVEQIMTWQKRELTESLLKMEEEYDRQTSCQMFRNLLSYMKDRDSSKKPISHASKYIRMVKASSPIVKDEAYLQIYKQLHNNKRRESLMRGWKFLAILSSCFVPNNRSIYYLILNFLFFELQNEKDELFKNILIIFLFT
jgi:hypothetical protein